MDSGSFADIVSAGAAILAVSATVWTVVNGRRITKIETERDIKSEERESRLQASQIAAWSIGRVSEDPWPTRRGLQIQNASNTPVYKVEIRSTYSWKSSAPPQVLPVFKMEMLPPSEFLTFGNRDGRSWEFASERSSYEGKFQAIMANPGWRVTSLRFVDAQENKWELANGSLKRLEP